MILSGPSIWRAFCRPTHVVLANVNALAANLDSHLNAVVDKQRDAEAARHGEQLAGGAHGIVVRGCLVAVLHDAGAAPQRGLDHGREVARAEDGGRRVGDEVFPEHNVIPSAFGTDGPLHSIYAEGKKEEENRSYAASERVDPEELVFDGICTVH
ncbi:hypothetical protein ACCO45_001633 [Purpureocillium lilacinum]|uniref:Uncharacterized protein n=1 Tax=Purpureocillium lilacinum TaxID=33203 RepID=A0ACC4E901_PURLI